MLRAAVVVAIAALTLATLALGLMASIGYEPAPPRPALEPPARPELECLPDRLVTGAGITTAHCFQLELDACKVTPGCALVPMASEL